MNIDRALLQASWESWISHDNRPPAGPWWLQWLWTLLFCMAVAVVFTVLGFVAFASGEGAWRNLSGWARWYGLNLIVCLTIGATIHLLFDLGRVTVARPGRLREWQPWQRTLFFSATSMLGVAIGWPLGVMLAGSEVTVWIGSRDGNDIIVGSIAISVLITFLSHHFFAARSRQLEAEKRVTEAQLRLLQAQIEPHFLFNTLANVQSLMDHDPPKAREMLSSFTDYLRATLGTLRSETSTVGHELDLAQSFLQLLQTRMQDRLRFQIDSDAAARSLPLPPLLLQPLVENAVVHGLEPSVDGGCVQVRARVDGGRLVLSVEDDGRGPDAAARPGSRGHGMALANIRERLRARYGVAGTLSVESTHPGTRAVLTLPLRTASLEPPARTPT